MPTLLGCVGQGNAIEEAIAIAREAIQPHIEGMIADGEPIPTETEPILTMTVDV